MFSRRLPWHLGKNPLSSLLFAKRAAGERVLDLTVSNPTAALPELYDSALLLPLSDPAGLRYQPTPAGDGAARAAVAAYYASRGLSANAEHLVLCASTSEAYTWLFQLLCNPGEQVLFPQPSYPLLEFLGGLAGIEAVPYRLYFDGRWRIDLDALRAALQPSTRALVLVSPNNPTGSLVHTAELAALFALCEEHGLSIVADEVFGDYLFSDVEDGEDPALPSLLAAEPEVAGGGPLRFVLSGLSKVVGLPQLKLGWIHTGGPEPLRSQAQDRLEIIADTFLSVSTPVQLAAPRLLGRQPVLCAGIYERIRRNRDALFRAVRGTALDVLPIEGGWYAVVRLPRILSEEEWTLTLLREDNLLCHPGYFFDFVEEAYIVLSLLTPPSELDLGVRRLLARTDSLS